MDNCLAKFISSGTIHANSHNKLVRPKHFMVTLFNDALCSHREKVEYLLLLSRLAFSLLCIHIYDYMFINKSALNSSMLF